MSDMAERLARHDRITKRIEAAFDEIDPEWRSEAETEDGQRVQRVFYGWGVQYGEARCDVGGPGITEENRQRFIDAIFAAIRAENDGPDRDTEHRST